MSDQPPAAGKEPDMEKLNVCKHGHARADLVCEQCEAELFEKRVGPVKAVAMPERIFREALESVLEDIEVCDWKCLICGADPKMGETDLAHTVRRALGKEKPEPLPDSCGCMFVHSKQCRLVSR